MTSEDGNVVLIFNGEIYNFKELRARLEARHHFRSATDSEVIVHLYEEQGPDGIVDLRGMFALGLWDRGRAQLLLARDRLGIKPLYYAEIPGGLIFASETKGLLASRLFHGQLSMAALDAYLAFGYVPDPHTLLEGIQAVPAGHYLTAKVGSARVTRYWGLEPGAPSAERRAPSAERQTFLPSSGRGEPRRIEEWAERLRAALEESIRLHQVSDVPVGAFLSGGIDSSAVVALMGRLTGQQVKTFTVGFGSEGEALNELESARAMARRLDTDHTEVIVSADSFREELDQIVESLDQPTIDGFNSYFVSKVARSRVKVALSGLGGDELFAGYPHSRFLKTWAQRDQVWAKFPMPLRKGLAAVARQVAPLDPWRLTARVVYLDRTFADLATRYYDSLAIFPLEERAALRSDALRGFGPVVGRPELPKSLDADPIRAVSFLDLTHWMNSRLLRDTDATSMIHSLEVRVPFLDHPLVELAFGLPGHLKLSNGTSKLLLRKCIEDLLPGRLFDGPKRGFVFPMEVWMRSGLWPVVCEALGDHAVRARGLFNPHTVGDLLRGFEAGTVAWDRIWALAVLELWMRRHLDGR
jgi:asparagine synthase (glutamine-hydrolysing)